MGHHSIVFRLCLSRNRDRRNCVLLDEEYSQSLGKGSRRIGIGIDCYRPHLWSTWRHLARGLDFCIGPDGMADGARENVGRMGVCGANHICDDETKKALIQ